MINVIKDEDIYWHFREYDIILIGTNIYCTMSQGIQLKVMLNYPYVYEKNLETKYILDVVICLKYQMLLNLIFSLVS